MSTSEQVSRKLLSNGNPEIPRSASKISFKRQLTEEEKEARGNWSNKAEFVLSCIGVSENVPFL